MRTDSVATISAPTRKRGSLVLEEKASDKPFDMALIATEMNRAYWAAYRVTKSASMAEDAVQEACAAMITNPQQYRGDDHMRSCFFTVVHRRALLLLRSEARRKRREGARFGQTPVLEAAPEETNESHELALAARLALASLPLDERTAVSMCCEQGFSLQTAAEVLGVPKPTLAGRVNRGLEKLRKILAQQGYSVATPLAVGTALGSLSLPPAPASLTATLRQMATNPSLAEKYAASVSAKALSGASTKSAAGLGWVWVTLTLLVATAGGVWWWNTDIPTGDAESKTDKKPVPTAVEKNDVFFQRWTFEKGPPEGFQIVKGEWSWRRNPETQKGEMINLSDVAAIIVPPVKMPNQPFEVKFTVEHMPAVDREYLAKRLSPELFKAFKDSKTGVDYQVVCDAYWEFTIENNSWWVRQLSMPLSTAAFERRVVFTERYSLQYQIGELCALMKYKRPYPNDKFFVVLKNCAISKIEVRTLRADEITEELREPLKNIERFKLKPWLTEKAW